MKKSLSIVFSVFVFMLFTLFFNTGYSQTSGTLTVNMTQISQTGSWGTKHCQAIWITNSINPGTPTTANFIKTKMRNWGSSTNDELPKWVSNSGSNTTDATTGATIQNYSTPISFTWDGKNVSGSSNGTVVADGTYYVYIEWVWSHGSSKVYTYFPFTKGTSTTTTNPTESHFSNISIVWTPVIPPSVTTSSLANSSFCAGDPVSVPFTLGGTFTSGNIFTAQLSDGTGSFSSPVSIGTLTGTSAGTINATIPSITSAGNAYRIRVTASQPATTGSDNGTNLTINAAVTPGVSISSNPANSVCPNTTILFTANPTNGGTPLYQWTVNGSNLGSSSTFSGIFNNGDVIACTMTSTATCALPATVSSAPYIASVYSVNPVTITETSGVITSNATSGNQWYEQTSGIIAGAIGVTFTPSAIGDYYTIVTDANGCTSISNVLHVIPTLVNEILVNNNISIHPNPTSGMVNVEINQLIQNCSIRIENILGVRIFEEKSVHQGMRTIDLSTYSDGIYFVNINLNNNNLRYKIVLSK